VGEIDETPHQKPNTEVANPVAAKQSTEAIVRQILKLKKRKSPRREILIKWEVGRFLQADDEVSPLVVREKVGEKPELPPPCGDPFK